VKSGGYTLLDDPVPPQPTKPVTEVPLDPPTLLQEINLLAKRAKEIVDQLAAQAIPKKPAP
jgi:hypothetical protein